uniref:Uncharacterized protein n=1 Tax=Nymphaea colorata TaxID=210225 RepID=A0A5K0WMU0_9MAGN
MFGDQHINERLVVDVLGVGLSVSNQKLMGLSEEQKTEELARRDQIERAMTVIFGNEYQAREMRRKAAVLGETVRKSVEAGGSSPLRRKNKGIKQNGLGWAGPRTWWIRPGPSIIGPGPARPDAHP